MGVSPAIWVDGEPATALPLPDRGLDFGDGLFETFLLRRGKPLFYDLHLQRLQAGLAVLGFPDCLAIASTHLFTAADKLLELEWAALRLTVTRGGAPRGYAPPSEVAPRVIITAAALSQNRGEFPDPVALEWAEIRWSAQPLLAGIKHLNRLEQVMAAREAQAQGCDDVIVLGQQGQVCFRIGRQPISGSGWCAENAGAGDLRNIGNQAATGAGALGAWAEYSSRAGSCVHAGCGGS